MGAQSVPWLDDDELRAWVGLIRLSARLVALADAELHRAHGITGRDYELLHHLSGRRQGIRVSELGSLIEDTSSCITHRVNRLARSGLVAKVADPTDARARLVRLTPAGRRLLATAAPGHVRRVRRWVIDALDRDELRQLAELTEALGEHLRLVEPIDGT